MPTTHTLSKVVASAVAAFAVSGAAHAAITTYTSSAAMTAATAMAATDSFNNLAIDFVPSPAMRAVGAYSYSASTPGGLYGAGTAADVWLSTSLAGDVLTFGGFGGGVRALGGLFFGSDITGSLLGGQTIVLTATDSAGATATLTLANATTSSFAGFVSTTQLTQVQAAIANTSAWVAANNVMLAVPEPATWALWLVGAAGCGGLAARRRRQAAVAAAAA